MLLCIPLLRLIEETQQRIVEKEARLAEIKASLDEHKAADVDRLKHRFYLMLGEWKKRKKAAMVRELATSLITSREREI